LLRNVRLLNRDFGLSMHSTLTWLERERERERERRRRREREREME
jgi:hypothetical protein